MKIPVWILSGSFLIVTALSASPYGGCRSCQGKNNWDNRSYNDNSRHDNYRNGRATPFYYEDWQDNNSDDQEITTTKVSDKKNREENGSETSMSDNKMVKKDLDSKINQIVKNYKDVNFKIKQNTVILTGRVDSEKDHKELVRRINRVEGVKSVDDRIEVGHAKMSSKKMTSDQGMVNKRNSMQAAAQPSDVQVQMNVQDALKGSMLNKSFENIIVEVIDGVVVLKGTVDKDVDKKELHKRVQLVDGVKSIDDMQVKVKPLKVSYFHR